MAADGAHGPVCFVPRHLSSRLLFPNPVCFLITRNSAAAAPGGTAALPGHNVMTVSWLTTLDNRGAFVMSLNRNRHTVANLLAAWADHERAGCTEATKPAFVLCPAVDGHQELLWSIGKCSGKDLLAAAGGSGSGSEGAVGMGGAEGAATTAGVSAPPADKITALAVPVCSWGWRAAASSPTAAGAPAAGDVAGAPDGGGGGDAATSSSRSRAVAAPADGDASHGGRSQRGAHRGGRRAGSRGRGGSSGPPVVCAPAAFCTCGGSRTSDGTASPRGAAADAATTTMPADTVAATAGWPGVATSPAHLLCVIDAILMVPPPEAAEAAASGSGSGSGGGDASGSAAGVSGAASASSPAESVTASPPPPPLPSSSSSSMVSSSPAAYTPFVDPRGGHYLFLCHIERAAVLASYWATGKTYSHHSGGGAAHPEQQGEAASAWSSACAAAAAVPGASAPAPAAPVEGGADDAPSGEPAAKRRRIDEGGGAGADAASDTSAAASTSGGSAATGSRCIHCGATPPLLAFLGSQSFALMHLQAAPP